MSRRLGDQLALALGPFVNRKLFSDHFLQERLVGWPEFADAEPAPLFHALVELWNRERAGLAAANEAQTEERFIRPVLAQLGFAFTVQAGISTAAGHRQPDYALFVNDADRAAANLQEGAQRYRRAVAVCDAKRFDRPLDRRRVQGALSEDPVAQIIHYIAITRCRWGVLTNGRLWRLYAAEGDMVEGASLEVDLCALLDAGSVEAFRYFTVLFSAGSFVADVEGKSLLDRALEGSRSQAVAVGEELRKQVFAAVPLVAEGLLGREARTAEALNAAFDNGLVVLYRLLFCLHAEDRGLLPVENVHYRAYSLREQREDLARDLDAGRVFSSQSDDKFNDLRALFRIVDKGDEALGVNEYNGGLFSPEAHPWLRSRTVPDDLMAEALDLLYRVGGEQVDYRDLSVRHLGTIFEQLLAFRLAERVDGKLGLDPAEGRKQTGAFFTPEHIVDDIVERTLSPLFDDRSKRAAGAGANALDELLDLHVLDPAMGSGHFLVGASAYLARRVANDPSYDGDLTLAELQGLVAERCLYGVDVNSMAVEVARLSLWLSTVRSDRPLRFLGNLRVGNSLVDADLAEVLSGESDLFASQLATQARQMLDRASKLRRINALTGMEAHEKERIADELHELQGPLLSMLDAAIDPPVSITAGRPLHWPIEFPNRFLDAGGELRADAGFDAVIGNPPYVRIQELGRDVAAYCRARYESAHGSFDAYVPFIERGVSLLRANGRLGFIVPSTFLKLDYGERLRERLADTRAVESIIDFGHAQIFEGATNYTCILIINRAGVSELAFTSVKGSSAEVRRELTSGALPPPERYKPEELGSAPWLLVGPEEREIIEAMRRAGSPLGDSTRQIFQGLITGADPVYILERVGVREGRCLVIDKAGREIELESDLLHPLASGSDVERYALRTLNSVLIFPYRRRNGHMELLSEDELRTLPRTWAYLQSHEEELRRRDRGKLDHDGWWAFARTQSLGLHDLPKLGVAATVRRLEVAADPNGSAYFHNVRVNGILPRDDATSLFAILAILNSRPVDFAFRRGAAPLQNNFFTANKQFISWLPIPDSVPAKIEDWGRGLYKCAAAAEQERATFLDWIASVCGTEVSKLKGWTKLAAYDRLGRDVVLDVLDENVDRLKVDPRSRAHREQISREVDVSSARLAAFESELLQLERDVDRCLADSFGLTTAQLSRIDSEYEDRS